MTTRYTAVFGILLCVALLLVGCSNNSIPPETIAPLIQSAALVLTTIEPESCDSVPFDEIRDAIDYARLVTASVEASCEANEPIPAATLPEPPIPTD
jgi:hypothetical protein